MDTIQITDTNHAITINGIEYIPRTLLPDERMRIAIVDNRGLTFVGMMSLESPAEFITIRNARCIIRWGTTEHLAQLASSGPTSNTRLGQTKDVKVNRASIVAVYDCDEVWNVK